MPYRIDQNGSQWCVVKDDGSAKKMGCHNSRDKAELQLRALYASEPEAEVEALFRDAHDALGESFSTQARIW